MPPAPPSQPSFSTRRKWSIGLNVGLIVLVVLSVVVMVNFLSRDYFLRFHLSARTGVHLSTRTVSFLKSLTNNVKVVLYYDRNDALYSTVSDLLNEYHLSCPKITVQTVDYLRDAGEAQKIKAAYNLTSPRDKNLIIFDCDGKLKILDGEAVAEYALEKIPERDREFRRRVAFKGEVMFTSMLLGVTNPRPFRAYFLGGHGEHVLDSGDQDWGYLTFKSVLQQNYIEVLPISLGVTNIPPDCNLLIIAGPLTKMEDFELDKIDQYLAQGGRLFALFNYRSIDRRTGLEKTGLDRILAKWGVELRNSIIQDPDNKVASGAYDIGLIIRKFSKHPAVNPLIDVDSGIFVIHPRMVCKLATRAQSADTPPVDEIAFAGPRSFADNNPTSFQPYPLMVAVEKGAIKGVTTERGTTRILVVGDSQFLANGLIESARNRDFVEYAANWLLDRTQLLEGIGPRELSDYRILMTNSQLQTARWMLLGAMPGAVLVLGGLVWLRRRK